MPAVIRYQHMLLAIIFAMLDREELPIAADSRGAAVDCVVRIGIGEQRDRVREAIIKEEFRLSAVEDTAVPIRERDGVVALEQDEVAADSRQAVIHLSDVGDGQSGIGG